MDRWTVLLIGFNVIYWSVFAYLVLLRWWSWSGLLVGFLHMLIATPLVLGPVRALAMQPGFNYQIGFLGGRELWALIPAVLVLSWALASAWMAVANQQGRWMLVGGVGDALMAANITTFILSMARAGAVDQLKIQGGSYFTIQGAELVTGILILVLAMPLVASSVWSFRRVRPKHGPPSAQTAKLSAANSHRPQSSSDPFQKLAVERL